MFRASFLCLILFFLVSPPARGEPVKVMLAKLNTDARMSVLKPDRVVATLGIKPGMSILDIGAGTGVFAFRFAAALNGTGMVYATDKNPETVLFLQKEASARGLKNVLSARVKGIGFDPFYDQHFYDLVMVGNLYGHISNPKDYFHRLRARLNDGGRVIIIQRVNHEFFLPHFLVAKDLAAAVKALKSAGEDHPIVRRLQAKTKSYIFSSGSGITEDEFRTLLSDDLNAMLPDPRLFDELQSRYLSLGEDNPSTAIKKMKTGQDEFALWLLGRLDDSDAFGKDISALSDDDRQMLNRLNGLCLRGILGLPRPFGSNPVGYLAEEKTITRVMTSAGFEPVERAPLLEHELLLEFRKKADAP
ncbi:MAG: methyltransferase domain-containing protein [Candidatus Omnitrophota bacterium]